MSKLVFLDPDDLNEIPFTDAEHGKGHVYIIEADNCIKIGKTINLSKRINALRTQSGRKFTRVCFTQPCKNYYTIETEMHKLFKDDRKVGEWFNTKFEHASTALGNLDLDLSEVETKNEDGLSKILDAFDKAYEEAEIRKFLDSVPVFKNYLEKNNYSMYFCKRSNEYFVTDGEDVELPLHLFIAIYKSHTA